MLNTSIAAVAKFRQALINEAFGLEDIELVKQINNMHDELLLQQLLECTDVERAAELSIDRIKDVELPF